MKKTDIYQDRKNLYKFFKKNHYIHQEFMNKSDYKVYKIYKNFEKHYSVTQIAILWFLSEDTIRRLFRRESGVIIIAMSAVLRQLHLH